jgi:hypothetical protein
MERTMTPASSPDLRPLTDTEIDAIAGGVGYDLSSGYGIVTALKFTPADPNPQPFLKGTNVPPQAAASYYNPSFVADGLYTAGQSPYGNGNPSGNVGSHA